MLDYTKKYKKIKPLVFDDETAENLSGGIGLAFFIFYLYALIVLAVYDFTAIGLIAAILIPVSLGFLFLCSNGLYQTSKAQFAVFFFVFTIFFLFIKNSVYVVYGIADVTAYGAALFNQPILSSIIAAFGVFFLLRRSFFSTVIGFLLCGIAMKVCFFPETGSGLVFLLVYAVFLIFYCITLYFSELAFTEALTPLNRDKAFSIVKHKRILNIVMLVLSIVFALLYRNSTEILDWAHVQRFFEIVFSKILMIPTVFVFLIYYFFANYFLITNHFDVKTSKRVASDLYFSKFFTMVYVLGGVLYLHYFTLNFLLLLLLILFCYRGKNLDLTFFNLVLLDVLVSVGRTETAIVILVFEWLLKREYDRIFRSLTYNDGKKSANDPNRNDIFTYLICQRTFWVQIIIAIAVIMSSLLLHIKSTAIIQLSFVGYIGLPDWKLLVIIFACSLISILAVNLLFYKSALYYPRYSFLVIVVLLFFVSCLVVVNRDTTFFRVDSDEKRMTVSYNRNDSEIESVVFYRGSNIPFLDSQYSDESEVDLPKSDSFKVDFPDNIPDYCERIEYLIEDGNGHFTSYDCYYPVFIYRLFEPDKEDL